MRKTITLFSLLFVMVVSMSIFDLSYSQGVTTSAINGLIVDDQNNPLPAANVIAVHEPSGTTYGAASRANGRYTIPGMRVGGPYTISVSYVGFEKQSRSNVYLNLGVATDVDFVMTTKGIQTEEVTIVGQRNAIFSSERTGASTSIDISNIKVLPTISRRIGDLTRLSPFAGNGGAFAGQDNRLNNITVDGSYFNNSFGLAGQPGDRTGVAPISLDAIEQVQINVAPYDVRQGNFVGAGVNTVTRSGNNEFSGSVYYNY
ncbi:MAG: carboxypeptidase regulatory-like domain-containing protein, partial [Ignavibacteriaceae bacterium]|nr:carboxypeptidase regulatory-like domain-containing protein [Ignavibacteriaceae bacterium]